MAGDGSQMKYEKIWVSDFFHSFPHFDFELETVNSTFDPESDVYRQATIFWGLAPVAVCILLWLVFVVYFIFRCCQSHAKSKPQPSACAGIVTGLLILTVIGLLGYGFHQNEEVHKGIQDGRRSLIAANTTISVATARVQSLDDIADSISNKISDDLAAAVSELNATIFQKATKSIDRIRKEASSVHDYIDKINIKDEEGALDQAIRYSADVDYYRWMVNIVIYSVYLFLVLMSFVGILRKSKVTLMMSAAAQVIFSIFIWSATGVYISSSQALGDLCVDPDTYFLSLAKGSASQATIEAYILCKDPAEPYQSDIQSALNSISLAGKDLNDTVKLAKPFPAVLPELAGPVNEMRTMLRYATGNLSTLLTNVGMCTTLHEDYVQVTKAVCIETLSATAILALISCLVAVLCTLIVFTLSCTWRQYYKTSARSTYLPVDDTDPFLPRPPQYEPDYGTMGHSSTTRPWSERGTLQHGVNSDDFVHMIRHQAPPPMDDSPPPAYHPGQYIRQYAESAPSPGSVGSNHF